MPKFTRKSTTHSLLTNLTTPRSQALVSALPAHSSTLESRGSVPHFSVIPVPSMGQVFSEYLILPFHDTAELAKNFANHLKAIRVFTLANKQLRMRIFKNQHIFHLNELGTQHQPAGKPLVSGQRGQLCQKRTQPIPGSRGRAAGRMASAASEDSTPGAPARAPGRVWEGKGTEPGDPGRPQPPRQGGGARFLDNRAGRSPSSGLEEGSGARGPPAQGRRRPGAPPAQPPRARFPGSCPAAARAYRVSPLQVTLLVAKRRDVDLHGCAGRPAEDGRGAGSRPRPPPRPRPGRPAPGPAPVRPGGCAARAQVGCWPRRPRRSGRPRGGSWGREPRARGSGRRDSEPAGLRGSLGPEEAGPGNLWVCRKGVCAPPLRAPRPGPHPGAPCPSGSAVAR